MTFGSKRLTLWFKVWWFRKRWPVLWAQTLKKQMIDYDDAHTVRPFATSPRLSIMFSVVGRSVKFRVKTAPGYTLEQLQQSQIVLAAQHDSIKNVDVRFDAAQDTFGVLIVSFTKFGETRPAERNISLKQVIDA